MDTKKCKRCGTEKPFDSFYQSDSSCKECRKLLVRKYRDINSEKIKEYDRERGKLQHRKDRCVINTRIRRGDVDGYMSAHSKVSRALKHGLIVREPCCMCGSKEKIHAHHDDYLKPLEVMWLCVTHHKSRHAFLEYIGQDIF